VEKGTSSFLVFPVPLPFFPPSLPPSLSPSPPPSRGGRDAQAQDRAHRIGQTKAVAVYRMLTIGSVEIEMMEAQISKKKLERLSITGGDFRQAGRRSRGDITTEGLRRLLADDVKDIQRRHGDGGQEGGKEGGKGGAEEDITEEELGKILDRKGMFEEGGLSVDGRMYDLVVIAGSDLLSGISQGNREGGRE